MEELWNKWKIAIALGFGAWLLVAIGFVIGLCF